MKWSRHHKGVIWSRLTRAVISLWITKVILGEMVALIEVKWSRHLRCNGRAVGVKLSRLGGELVASICRQAKLLAAWHVYPVVPVFLPLGFPIYPCS